VANCRRATKSVKKRQAVALPVRSHGRKKQMAKKRRYFNRLKTIRKISTQLSAQGLGGASKVRLIIATENAI
jgi:hypothetical protein